MTKSIKLLVLKPALKFYTKKVLNLKYNFYKLVLKFISTSCSL